MFFEMEEANLWANVIIPMGFFILLSPGAFFNLPLNSSKQCSTLIPLPTMYSYMKGDGEGTSDDQNVTSSILNGPGMSSIHDARKKCLRVFSTGYTSVSQTIVHALIFVFACAIARSAIVEAHSFKINK